MRLADSTRLAGSWRRWTTVRRRAACRATRDRTGASDPPQAGSFRRIPPRGPDALWVHPENFRDRPGSDGRQRQAGQDPENGDDQDRRSEHKPGGPLNVRFVASLRIGPESFQVALRSAFMISMSFFKSQLPFQFAVVERAVRPLNISKPPPALGQRLWTDPPRASVPSACSASGDAAVAPGVEVVPYGREAESIREPPATGIPSPACAGQRQTPRGDWSSGCGRASAGMEAAA